MIVNSSIMGLFSLQVVVFCFLLSCSELLAAGQRKVSRNVQSVGADVKQGLDFDCPEEFGYYPHPTDCTQYYVCVFGGALLESCTGGLMYSHELQTCDWPRNVGCDVAGEVPVAPVQASSAARSAPEPRSRYTVAPPPAPPAPAQPNPVVTSHGQPRQLHHHQDQQDYITKQQQQRQQQLYEEADESLPPVEEVETDRQQRVYRGQPSTVGQVQRDRDALRHTNAIPSPIREKISFGTQQQQPIQQYRETITPQHDPLDANIDDVLTNNLTQTTLNRLKRQIRYRIRERIPKSRVKISWTSDSATPLTAVASNIRHIYVPSETTNKHITSNVHHKQHHPVDLRSSVVKTFRPSVPINEQTSGGTFKPIVPNNPYHNLPIHTLLPIIHRSSFTTQRPLLNGNYSVTPTGTFSYFNLNNNNNQAPLTRQTHNHPNDDSNFAYYYNVQPTAAQTSFNPISLTTGVPQIITQSYNDLRYIQNNPQQKYYNSITNIPTKVYPSALPIQNFSQPFYGNIYKLTPQEDMYNNVKPTVENIHNQKNVPKHEQIPEESVDYSHDESTPIPEESKESYNEDNEQKEDDYEEYDSKDGNNRYTDNEQRSEDDHETTTTESAFSHIEDFTIPSFFYKTENKFANIVNPFADPNFDFDKFISSIRDSNIGIDTEEEKVIDDKSAAESQVNDLENKSKNTIQIKPTKYSKLLMDSVDIRTPRPFRPSSHKKETDKVLKTTTSSEFLNDEYYDIETTKIPKINKQPILNQESKITYKKKLSDEDYRYGDDSRKQHNHEEVKDNQPIPSNHRFTKKDQSRVKYVDNFNITQATQQTSLKPTYTNSVSSKQNRPLTRFNSRPTSNLYEPYKYVTTENPKTSSVTVRPKLNRIRTTTESINKNLADSFPVKEDSSRRPTRKGKRPMRLTTTLKTVSFDYDHSDTKDDGRIDSINRVEPSTSAPEQYISARPVNVAAGSRNLYNGSQSYDPQQYDPYYTIYDDDVELYRDVDYGHNYANSNTNSNSNNNQQQQHQHHQQQQHQQQQQQHQQQQQQPPRQPPQHVYRGTPAPATQNAQIQAETVSQRNPSQYIQTAPAYNPQPPSPADVYQTSSIEDYSEEEDPNQYPTGRQPVRGDRNELNYVAEPPTIRTTTSTSTTSRPIPVSSRSPNTAQVNQTRPQPIFITLSATPRHIPTVHNSDSSSEATITVDSDREIDLISTTPKLLSRIISLTSAFLFQDKDNKNNNSDTYTTESRPGKITKIPDFAQAAVALDNKPRFTKDDTTKRQTSNDNITVNRPTSFKITNLPTAENKSVFIQLNTRSLGTSADILTLNLNNISSTEQTESPNKRDVSNKYDEIDSKGRNTILRSNSTHITPTTYSPPKSFLDSLLQKTSTTFRNIPLISNFRSDYSKSNTNSKSQFLDDSYDGNRADNYIPVSVPPQTVSSLSKRVQVNPATSGDPINYRQLTSSSADSINARLNKPSHRTRLTTTSTEKHPTISIPKHLRPTQKDIYDIDSLVEDVSTNDTDEVPFIPKQHNNRYIYDIVESRPSQKLKYSKEDSKNEASLIFKEKETGLQENPIRQTGSHYDLEKDVETAIFSRGRNIFRFGSASAEDSDESPVVSRVRFGNAYRPTEKLLDITTLRYSPKYETTTKQIFTQLQNNQEIRPVIIKNNDEISVAPRGQFIPVYTQEIRPITQRGRYFTDINTTPAERYIQPTPVIRGHFVTETTPFNTAKTFKTTSSIHVPVEISSTPYTSTDAIFHGTTNFETDNISSSYARNNETPTKITIPTDINSSSSSKNNQTKEDISNTETYEQTVRKNSQSRYTSSLGTSSEKPLNLLYTHRQLNLDLPSTENIWQKISTEKYHNEKSSEQYRLESSSAKPDAVIERHRIPSRYTTELTLSKENENNYSPRNKFASNVHPEVSEINSFIKNYELNNTTELPRQLIRVKTVPVNRFTIETNPNHRDATPYPVENGFELTGYDESSSSTNNSLSSEKSESSSPQLINNQNNIFRATVEIPSAPDLTDSHEDSDNNDDVIRSNLTIKPTSNPIPIPSLNFRSGSGSSSPDLTNKTSISNPGRASRVNTAIKSIAMLSGARGTSSKCNTGYNSTIPNTKCNEIQQRTSNTRGRGSAHYTNAGAGESIPVNRGTPPPRSRPTLKPSTSIVSKASEFIDVYKNPPTRPAPVYPQPTPDKAAAKCRKDVCLLPDCSCGGKEIPGNIPVEEVPQLVLLTFDDAVNDLNKGTYNELFERGRVNPNGCPISATFYVSHEWTDYSQVQNLYADGHEMASHTVSLNRFSRLNDWLVLQNAEVLLYFTFGDLPVEEVPQIVLLTFDDSVNDLNKGLYSDLFEKGRVNPNGCPITATFYVSHEWTDYSQVQNLYAAGHEIASHTISHSFGEQFSQKKWNREVGGQREILAAYGGVKLEDVRGMRAPFLSVGGNKMFKMLYDSNFTYDSSMPVYENRPPSWPYTLDYKLFHDCMIPPCPTRSYPGVWEVPMVMWQDLNGGRCSMGDACSNPPTAEGVYKMLFKNFERHYTTNRAPFGLFYHAAWFTQPHHKEGFINFLDAINSMKDVYLVTNWQAIQWVRDPTPISRLANFQPFQCNYPNRPKRCNNPKVCNLWHKSGVRYMRTCQPCPDVYPWTGKTGIKSSRIDNDIED